MSARAGIVGVIVCAGMGGHLDEELACIAVAGSSSAVQGLQADFVADVGICPGLCSVSSGLRHGALVRWGSGG